jgi:serine protease
MLKRKICSSVGISIFILFIAVCLAVSVSAEANPKNVYTGNLVKRASEFAPGRVVVKFADSVADDEVEQIVRGQGAQIHRTARKKAFHVLRVPRGQVWQKVEALKSNSRVVYAHPDYLAYADAAPVNDPYYHLQWNLDNEAFGGIEMEQAWGINPGGAPSVVVAVLDTGVAYEDCEPPACERTYCQADDLGGTSFVAGYDFVNHDNHPNDDNSHGTHVAGTIAQTTNNGEGVAGVAYMSSIMPLKVLNSNGSGYISDIAEAIRWAADYGANVINMSLSSLYPSAALQEAVAYAYNEKNVVLVASSGNYSEEAPRFPAYYPEVIATGATTYDEKLASYSNRGNELCAPGGVEEQDLNGDGYPDMVLQNTFNPDSKDVCDLWYWFFGGTSMAAPHVSGLAALILAENPTLSNEQVRQILKDTADEKGTECGSGIINAQRALEVAAGFDATPSVSIVAPADGAAVSDLVTVQIDAYDSEDNVGSLSVQWNVDGGAWQDASYNEISGFYEVAWDTTNIGDGDHTLNAQATDSAGNPALNSISVFVSNNGLPPSVHIADLYGESGKFWKYFWYAAVDILVHDHTEQPVNNARVDILWSDGSVDWCTTGNDGECSVVGYTFRRTPFLKLTVTNISNTGLPYEPSLNHDPDGDSNGTSITIYKP